MNKPETTTCPGCGCTRMTAEVEAGVPCDVDECSEGDGE